MTKCSIPSCHREADREYELDSEQGIYAILDILEWDEIYSLLKSNRISWTERRLIKFYCANRTIKELIPVVMIVGAAAAIMGMIKEVVDK